jgi:hypothetical protein
MALGRAGDDINSIRHFGRCQREMGIKERRGILCRKRSSSRRIDQWQSKDRDEGKDEKWFIGEPDGKLNPTTWSARKFSGRFTLSV